MSLRHPPRLSESGEDEPDPFMDIRTGGRDDVPSLLSRAERRATSAVLAARMKEDRRPSETEACPVLPPFATDFGPKTLVEYLRAEVDKLKNERRATSGKGKGKAKEAFEPTTPGLLHPSNSPTPTHGLFSPSAPPTLADRVDDRQSAAGPSIRRSQRLARRDSENQEAIQDARGYKKIPLPRPLSQQPSIQEDGLTSPPSGAGSTRAIKFEEHTKYMRLSVRNTTLENLTSPLRARLRQRRHSRGLLPSGAYTDMGTDSSATPPAVHYPITQQHDIQEHPQIALLENEATSSVRHSTSLPRQEATSNETVQTSSDGTILGSPTSQAPTQSSLCAWDTAAEDLHSPNLSFDYTSLIPEVIPPSEKDEFIDQTIRSNLNSSADFENRNARSSWVHRFPFYGALTGRRERSDRGLARATSTVEDSDPTSKAVSTPGPEKQYPRAWRSSMAPSMSLASTTLTETRSPQPVKTLGPQSNALQQVDADLWTTICRFLSTQDVRNLRLVNKSLARVIAPIQFRDIVVNFDRDFFDTSCSNWDDKSRSLPSHSMFKKYGASINKFGVCFEYDLQGLSYAKAKTIEKEQDAWFGKFTWPIEQYPRFPELQAIEDLVDHNRPLLKEALQTITRASELGLCIDSGHGWLEGPDISDMALFNRRITKGSKVFGKTFKTEDVWITFARNEYFRWAQQNTLNATIKELMTKQPTPESAANEIRFLDGLQIRDIESFRCQDEQYDYDPEFHVGGGPVLGVEVLMDANGEFPNLSQAHFAASRRRLLAHARNGGWRLPQWPLIFSGYNLAAEHGGHCPFVQSKTVNPAATPLLPGSLTEPQAQWLMETVWAQRAFLSAYTTAIITHKQNFRSIHTLRISKLSSGLLPSLEQGEFWKSLSGLKTLEILISPDWRREHVTGDRSFDTNMLIPPTDAAARFTKFLKTYIAKIENLHSLSIGYVGGGEHAVGMFARNKHVLPAPIVDDPSYFLIDDGKYPEPIITALITKFDHVRELKYTNCWFTPWMLQGFMKRSRDTSLHSLTLDSVSMTAYHDPELTAPTWNVLGHIRCLHPRQAWTREILPTGASWARVLDAITPGKTLLAHQYDAGLIDTHDYPMPKPTFRGNVEEIVVNSCGYVKIELTACRGTTYNQNALVLCAEPTMDDALQVRKARFTRGDAAKIMIPKKWWGIDQSPWLGTLTQCIHPIEKRVLEEAWQMTFGWPNNLDRWAAVEDGQLEGGTGRFSGVIRKSEENVEEC